MKISALRKLVQEYNQIGLPIEKRAQIKKKLGKNDYNIVSKEYDSFLKSNILADKPDSIMLNDKGFICQNVRLKRNSQNIFLFSAMTKENILEIFSSAKTLSKLPVNKTSCLYQKPCGSVNVIQLPSETKKRIYRIITNKGEEMGAFSINEENLICGLFLSSKFRKKPEAKEAALAIKKLLADSGADSYECCVSSQKAFLVRMYEKFGFEPTDIISLNRGDEDDRTFFKLQQHRCWNLSFQ